MLKRWRMIGIALAMFWGCNKEPEPTVIIDQSFTISYGCHEYKSVWLNAWDKIEGYFDVEEHDINFFICTELEYYKWKDGEDIYPEVEYNRSSYASFSFTVYTEDTYYFVMDNRYSYFTGKDVHLYATKTPKEE